MSGIEKALQIAMEAHRGQKDRAGVAYIMHPITVAASQKSEEAIITALLHDVVEDSDVTLEDIREAGFSDDVLEAISLLTHEDGVDYMSYVEQIKQNELAKAVKIADLMHNSDLSRLKSINQKDIERVEKYKKAIRILSA